MEIVFLVLEVGDRVLVEGNIATSGSSGTE